MNNGELLIWLKDRREYIKIDRIAKEIKMPGRTLNDWVNNKRPLPEKYAQSVSEWVKEFLH